MVKSLLNVILVLGLVSASLAGGVQRGANQVHPQAYRPGVLVVKYRTAAVSKVHLRQTAAASGIAYAGIASVDRLNEQHKVYSMNPEEMGQPKDIALAHRLGMDRYTVMHTSESVDIIEMAKKYAADPNVEYASPDWYVYTDAVPNDPNYSKQWGHKNTGQMPAYNWSTNLHNGPLVGTVGFDAHAETAWDQTTGYGSSTVVIGIIDTGTEWAHPDLAANIWTNPGESGTDSQGRDKRTNGVDDDGNGKIDDWHGWDFGVNDNNPNDDASGAGHGTCTAGIAAAVANNGVGVAGVAGNCKILPLKVASANGSLAFTAINAAITYGADMGAKVLSMSLGGTTADPANQTACTYAWNKGTIVLAATGNENNTALSYPAANANCLGIGAASNCGDRKRSSSLSTEINPGVHTDPNGYTCDGERWWGSNYGVATADANAAVDVIAPTILPTTDRVGANGFDPTDYDLYFNGTSCATPYAAGVCALIYSKNPTWTASQVAAQLKATATDVVNVESGAGWDKYSGYGMVNAANAVGYVPPVDTIPPVISGVSASSITSTSAVISWTTDKGSNSTVDYGTTSSYGTQSTNGSLVTAHSVTLNGLLAGTVYHYRVTSANASGYGSSSVDHSFQTGGSSNYAPSATTITSGTLNSGTVGNMAANDALYYTLNSTTSGTRKSDWYGSVTITEAPSSITKLTVTYDGDVSRSHTQVLYLYNWTTSAWVQVDSRTVSTTDVTVTYSPATASTYISSTGQIRLRVYSSSGNQNYTCKADYMRFTVETSGSVISRQQHQNVTDAAVPYSYKLEQNYPNPFNPTTNIQFELAEASNVTVTLYNVYGQQVSNPLNNQAMEEGQHNLVIDGSGLASGTYFYRFSAVGPSGQIFQNVRKMTLLK